jgi:hypothetical protein
MTLEEIIIDEIQRSVAFFLDFTNLQLGSSGFGLTADSTKTPNRASIASVGYALTAWVIAAERRILPRSTARQITAGTLKTLLQNTCHYKGFFAHFLDTETGARFRKCEFSTIDTAICLNGVITAAAYFHDAKITQLAEALLDRVDWGFFVFEQDSKSFFRMSYNPDRGGSYVVGEPGFISQWNNASEQKMMYLQAAKSLIPEQARKLYADFSRDIGDYQGKQFIINPLGSLYAYLCTEAWLDSSRYMDAFGINWFENLRLAALANRQFCLEHAEQYCTYHADSWGISSGDSPQGYAVFSSMPCFGEPYHNGTVSIWSAVACLPVLPVETSALIEYLYTKHPQTFGKYGFFSAYNLDVQPPWYSHSVYGIEKGCSMIMLENYLTGLIWDVYTNCSFIQNALNILGFTQKDIPNFPTLEISELDEVT